MIETLHQSHEAKMVEWLIGLIDQGAGSEAATVVKQRAGLVKRSPSKTDSFGSGWARLRVFRSGLITVARVLVSELIKEHVVSETIDELMQLVKAGCDRLVVDIRDVQRITSPFVATLAEAHRRCLTRQGGMLRLCGVCPQIRPIFQLTGLDREIPIFADQQSAIQYPWPYANLPRALPISLLAPLCSPDRKIGAEMLRLQDRSQTQTVALQPLQLRIEAGKKPGKVIVIRHSPFMIGRDETCRLRFLAEVVSRFHAQVEANELSGWWIRDLGSRNGTWLNCVRLEANVTHRLAEGDRFEIGPFACSILSNSGVFEERYVDETVANWLRDDSRPEEESDETGADSAPTQDMVAPPLGESARSIRVRAIQDVTVIAPRAGELLDDSAVEALQETLHGIFSDRPSSRVVVDLGMVSEISSRSLGVILATALNLARNGGGMRLAYPRPGVRTRLQLFRVADLVPVFDTLDEAVVSSWS